VPAEGCACADISCTPTRCRGADLSNILPSNRNQIERAINKVVGFGQRDIAVLGFSFKPGTDDLRESPQVELIERLIGKGYNQALRSERQSVGADGCEQAVYRKGDSHIGSIKMTSLRKTVVVADVIIIGNASPEFRSIEPMLSEDQIVLDLARLWESRI
jgi:GDP-mannose 6-dehydrogenase